MILLYIMRNANEETTTISLRSQTVNVNRVQVVSGSLRWLLMSTTVNGSECRQGWWKAKKDLMIHRIYVKATRLNIYVVSRFPSWNTGSYTWKKFFLRWHVTHNNSTAAISVSASVWERASASERVGGRWSDIAVQRLGARLKHCFPCFVTVPTSCHPCARCELWGCPGERLKGGWGLLTPQTQMHSNQPARRLR